jgi:hypothetical protein
MCVIVTAILKVLQLFLVATSEYLINRLTNPNPRLNHPTYVIVLISEHQNLTSTIITILVCTKHCLVTAA